MMQLSTLLQGIAVTEQTAAPELELTGVTSDSRRVQPGSLFLAVPGYTVDGHNFIAAAVAAGAAAVLCERKPEIEVPYILVADARAAEPLIAANWYGHPAEKLRLVGVTGTNGKTSTTYLLKSLLENATGAKVGLIGTIQNLIGDEPVETNNTTPGAMELQQLFARMVEAGCTFALMEVSSHALDQGRVAGLRYETAIFTNLTEDHLDYHKTMEAYGDAKALLFGRCDHAVLNADDPAWKKMAAAFDGPPLTYAQQAPAALQAEHVQLEADHIAFDAVTADCTIPVQLGIPGGFTVYNTLAVLGAAMTLGIALPDAAAALADAKGVKGRVEVVPTPGEPYTVLIDYAHTPDGLENVLRSVKGFCKGRTVAVFGCGGDRDPIKRPIMGRIAVELADFVVVTSDNPRTEEPMAIIHDILEGLAGTTTPYVVVENRREAIRWAMSHAQPDDIIVLAGKGHETYQIIGKEKTHLDEREEVAAYLAAKDE